MSQRAFHQPRVAFDAARAIVSVAGLDDVELRTWFTTGVADLLGPAYGRALLDTRQRLIEEARPETPFVETGVWRVRFEDLLRTRPQLTEEVHFLTLSAATRLTGRTPR
jgi:hypothetical protein